MAHTHFGYPHQHQAAPAAQVKAERSAPVRKPAAVLKPKAKKPTPPPATV